MLFFNKLFSCFFQSQNYQRTRNSTKKLPKKEMETQYWLLTESLKTGQNFTLNSFLTSYFGSTGKHEMIWVGQEEKSPESDWFPASRMRGLSVSVMGETRSTSRNGCIGTCTGSRNCGDSCWFCHVEKKPSVCFRLWVSLCYYLY